MSNNPYEHFGLSVSRPKTEFYLNTIHNYSSREMKIADMNGRWVVIVKKLPRNRYEVVYFENSNPNSTIASSDDLNMKYSAYVSDPAELASSELPEAVKSALSWHFQKWKEHLLKVEAVAMLRDVKRVPRMTEREAFIQEIAEALIKNYDVARIQVRAYGKEHDLGIRCFNGKFWEPCEDKLLTLIRNVLLNEQMAKVDRRLYEEVKWRIESSGVKVLEYQKPLLIFENVVLDVERFLETGNVVDALKPHSKSLFAFHHIPHNLSIDMLEDYVERAGVKKLPLNRRKILEMLKSLCREAYQVVYDFTYYEGIDPDVHRSRMLFVLEMIGRALVPGYRVGGSVVPAFKNVFVLLGEGGTGKSTFLREFLGNRVVGEANYEVVNLGKLCSKSSDEVERELGKLYEKNPLVAMHLDLGKNTPVRDWSMVRQVSGGDPVPARKLYEDSFSYLPAWKIFIATNDPPVIREEGVGKGALMDRFKVLEVKNKSVENKPFPVMNEECLEAVILASLYAIYHVYRAGEWSFTGIRDIEDALNRYTFSAYYVVMEMIEKGRLKLAPSLSIRSSELYQECQRYVNEVKSLSDDEEKADSRYSLPDQSTFTKQLKRLLAKHGVTAVSHGNHTVFKGIGLPTKKDR